MTPGGSNHQPLGFVLLEGFQNRTALSMSSAGTRSGSTTTMVSSVTAAACCIAMNGSLRCSRIEPKTDTS